MNPVNPIGIVLLVIGLAASVFSKKLTHNAPAYQLHVKIAAVLVAAIGTFVAIVLV